MVNIDYQFIPVPTNLFYSMDNNCTIVLITLIQLSIYFMNKGEDVFDGWFFRTNALLEAATNLSRRVLNGALGALYQHGIIDIIPQPKGKGSNQEGRKYKVHFDAFKKYESISIEDCSCANPDYGIRTLDYKKGAPSFQKSAAPNTTPHAAQLATPSTTLPTTLSATQSRNNIDIIDNKEIINNKKNIENIEHNILNNIYLEHFVPVSDYGVSEKEERVIGKGEVTPSNNPDASNSGFEFEIEDGHDSDHNTLSNASLSPAGQDTPSYSKLSPEEAPQEQSIDYSNVGDGLSEVCDIGCAEELAAAPLAQEGEQAAIRKEIDKLLQVVAAWKVYEYTDSRTADSNCFAAKALYEQLEPNREDDYYKQQVLRRILELIEMAKQQRIRVMQLPLG